MKRPKGPTAKRDQVFDAHVGRLWATLAYRPYKIGVVASDWRRWNVDHWEYWPSWGREKVPKPIVPGEGSKDLPAFPRPPSELLATLTELQSYLSDVEWPQGGLIGDVQLSIRTKGHRIQAQLKLAAHGGLRLTAEANGVDEALLTLEACLQAQTVPWERDPYPLGGAGGKKK